MPTDRFQEFPCLKCRIQARHMDPRIFPAHPGFLSVNKTVVSTILCWTGSDFFPTSHSHCHTVLLVRPYHNTAPNLTPKER